MFSEDIINRVRDNIDIVDLVSGYVSLKKTGKNFVGLCPFHSEKTPSFSVNPEKQIFHCFGCGAGGDAFKFVESQEGLNFPEAVKRLASRAGVVLPADNRTRKEEKKSEDERQTLLAVTAEAGVFFQRELEGPAGSAARAYLAKRGVSESAVKDFTLGYARPEWDGLLRHLKQKGYPLGQMEKAGLIVKRSEGDGYYDRFRGRIIFPIRDLSGKVIAFGGRVMDDSLPKYLNSPETPLYSKSNILYGLDQAKEHGRKLGYFIIVEGYLDAIACHQYGAKNAVATLGTALTDGHLRLMRRFAQKLIVIFDPDPAGVNATLRGIDLFLASGMKVNVVSLPDGDDPDTFLQKRGHEAFSARLRESVKFMDFVFARVLQRGPVASIDEKVERAGEMLAFIEKLPSGIERDHYIKKTAEALDVDEAVLRQEKAARNRSSGVVRGGAKSVGPAKSQRPRAEEMLIHLMLKDEDIAREIKAQIGHQDFTDPLYRRAAEKVFDALGKSGRVDIKELLRDGDDELGRLFAHYSVLDAEYGDPGKTCRDCVDRIKQHGHTKSMKALSASIKEAESRGDAAELRRLLEEQRQLLRDRRSAPGNETVPKTGQ